MQTLILAGGLGTRLKPITETIPKSLVPILGEPFISHQLRWLAQCGIRDVVLAVGYKSELVRDFVRHGEKWGLRVEYSDEGDQLRGTAGAIRWALEQDLLEDSFMVTYGDSYLPIGFHKVWETFKNSKALALMTILNNAEKWDSSNVCFDGEKITLYDKKLPASAKPKKMHFIDYGLSAFQKSVILQEVPSATDLSEVFHHLSLKGDLQGLEVTQRFYEIGSFQGIQDLEAFLDPERNLES